MYLVRQRKEMFMKTEFYYCALKLSMQEIYFTSSVNYIFFTQAPIYH